MSKKVALVTGATGFIGSNLVRRLVKENWQVAAIVLPQISLEVLKDCYDDVMIFEHDGSTRQMTEIIRVVQPEAVFHLAALVVVEHQPEDIEPLVRSNVLFGTQLVDAMVQNGVFNLVNTGTSWQHFQNEVYNPVCLYAATKQAFESILKFYTESTPLKAITLKLFDTYGPNDSRSKLLQLLEKSCKTQQPLSMSPGEQRINLVYIDDIVEAFLMAAERNGVQPVHSYEDFAVASQESIGLKDLVLLYERLSGNKVPVNWGCRPYRKREVMAPWNNGKQLPGWVPKVDIREGLKRTIQSNRFPS